MDAAARDAEGAPLLEGFRRRLKVGPAQRAALDAAAFRLAVPAGERAALEVEFPVALDRAWRFPPSPAGKEAAKWKEASSWRRRTAPPFLPAEPWRRGEKHILRVGEPLEDVAGNRLGRAFEVPSDAPVEASTVEIPFNP